MSRTQRIQEILLTLEKDTERVLRVALLDSKGLIVATSRDDAFSSMAHADIIGYVASNMLVAVERSSRELDPGKFIRNMVEWEKILVVMVPVFASDFRGMLVAECEKDVLKGVLFYNLNHAAKELEKIF